MSDVRLDIVMYFITFNGISDYSIQEKLPDNVVTLYLVKKKKLLKFCFDTSQKCSSAMFIWSLQLSISYILCWWIYEELTGKDLEGSCEEEASALLQSEELAEEEEERQAAEDDGQDHESLDCLNPLCRERSKKDMLSITNHH